MNNSSSDGPFLRLLGTGAVNLLVGFVLWFGLLAVDGVAYFLQIARHPHQHDFRAFSLFSMAWAWVGLYPLSFFVSAFAVGRLRWSFRPVLAAPLFHALFLACYLPTLDWGRRAASGAACLLLPLATSALGAFFGERSSAKRRDA